MREKGNNFHHKVSYVMPEMLRLNTFPRTLVGDDKGFHGHALRRVVPEPWLLD